MTIPRSAMFFTLIGGLLLAAAPVARAEVSIYGIGGTATVGGGRGPRTDTNYGQGNTNMIHPGSIGGGVGHLVSIGGSSTDDASSTGGGHANLRGLGPTAKVGVAGNRFTKIGGTGFGAAVPGGLGG